MQDLRELAYLDIGFDGNEVQFGSGLLNVKPAIRKLKDAVYAFYEDTTLGPSDLYYMYRNVANSEDNPLLEQRGLRFDVTVIPPGLIGKEFNKTVGHYHPVKPGTNYTYPEVYEVLCGEATYILQRPGATLSEVEDFSVYKALPGDKVVIPPGYGHITINAGNEPLVMANWVAGEFSSVYTQMRQLRGGAYYLVSNEGRAQWVCNPRYTRVPEVRFLEVQDYPEYGLVRGKPMYELIHKEPNKLRFLTHPEEFNW